MEKFRSVIVSEKDHGMLLALVKDYKEMLLKTEEDFREAYCYKRKYRNTIADMYREKAASAQAVIDALECADIIRGIADL